MKNKLLFIICCVAQHVSLAQVPAYMLDSTSFSALTLEGGQTEMQFSDINQDGHPDLLTVGDHGSPFINSNQQGINVFFGNGTGSGWTLGQSGNFGYGGIAVGDINNDGFLDVAYGIHHNYAATDFGDQLIEAALGDGTGLNWIPWDDSLATAGETWGMFGTDLGDVNNDGLLDLLSGSFGCCAGTHVYLNSGTGVWQHAFGFLNNNTEHYVQLGDLNHDGNLDFVCCHSSGAAYFGDGSGNFTQKHVNLPPLSTLGFYDVSLSDIDNDGDDDFGFIHTDSRAYVYKWNNNSQQWVNHSAGLDTTGMATCIKLADLNGDGFSDAVVAFIGTIKIYLGNGGLQWNNVFTIPSADMTFCQDIAIADVDHNGFPEIAFWANYDLNWFSDINKLKILRDTSTAIELKISQNYPKGYECLPNNAVRFITWTSSVPAGNAASVKIEFSSGGLAGPWSVITNAAPDNGNFQWLVPPGIMSMDCYIRLVITDSVTSLSDTAHNVNPFQVGVCNPALSINPLESNLTIDIYPNPVGQQLTVSGLKLPEEQLRIYDILAREIPLVELSRTSTEIVLKTATLPKGIYLLKSGMAVKYFIKN